VLNSKDVVREFIALVDELETAGYFEKRFGKNCVDESYGDGPSRLIQRELGLEGVWPLGSARLAGDIDLLFDVIEVLHDLVARPLRRYSHRFGGCGWHHENFEIEPGRLVYRWRVNKILDRSDLGLRLSEEGADVGRLVATTDDARTTLVHELIVRDDGEPADQVRHAIELFRARGADRNQKRSAVVALALVHLVGHDWGGLVAWSLASRFPEKIATLTVVATPHPRAFVETFLFGKQLLSSWYMIFFQIPWLPEAVLRARNGAAAQDPYPVGMSRHGAPVRTRHRIPSINRRLCHNDGRPDRDGTGSNGSSTAHSPSVRSNRPATAKVSTRSPVVFRFFLVDEPSTGDLTHSRSPTRQPQLTCWRQLRYRP
jgi:hypothetical protein